MLAENVAHNLCCQWKSLVTFTGACANEIIPSIIRWFVYKAKEGGHVRIHCSIYLNYKYCFFLPFMSLILIII